jgi:transposase
VVEYDEKEAPLNGGKIGVDLGLKDFLITSVGNWALEAAREESPQEFTPDVWL